ncbi:hypothetical protein SE17_10500 [Kouleothrix aurantiaca]|uniref:CHAT domain-containing protein n=1 Tax=Kouleothrix aurantiaca TaxID=186479 RepID=A0A0P9F9G9_9CHLR|nr:hypothetical protein SE17_10500 [Kouleothrix aurantiaca]
MERQQLENLRALYRSRLQSAEQQQAQLGMNTPPHTILYIEELRGQVADIERQLDQRQRDDEAQVLAAGPAHNEALEQLREQRDTAQRSLHFLEQQRAYFGPAAPLNVLNDIQETRAQLAQLDAQIKEIAGDIGVPNVKAVEEITHLQALRAIQQRRLSILEEQRAMLGRSVQTEIAIEISVLTQELEATEQRLREYGASLEAPYIPDEVTVPLSIEELNLLEQLRQEHQRRLQFLEAQQAMYDIYTPPHIIMEIEDARVAIARIDGQLGVYQKEKTHASAVSQSSDNSDGDVQPPILGAEEREQLEQLREAHQRRLQTLEYQRARRGNDTPSELAKEIEDIRSAIGALDKRLGYAELHTTNNEIPLDANAQTRLESLRDAHLDRLQQLERRSATQGSDVHPDVPLEIESIRENIRAIDQQLNAPNEDKVIPQSTEIPASAVPTRPQLEQQRAEILRRLQQLEQRSHLSPEPTPQSATEAAELRGQLSDIEEQLAELIIAETPTEDEFEAPRQTTDEAFEIVIIHIAQQGNGYSISFVSNTGILRATLAPSEAQLEELAALARRRLDEIVSTQVDGQFVYQSSQATIAPEIYGKSLRALAEAGSFMYQQLFFRTDSSRNSHALGNRLRELSQRTRLRITIISERVFLPWTLLYDRETIEPGNIDTEGFWGFRHVIECQLPSTSANLPPTPGGQGALISTDGTLQLAFVGDNGLDSQVAQRVVDQQRATMSALPNVGLQDYSSASDFNRLLNNDTIVADVIYIYVLMLGNSDTNADDMRICLGDEQITLTELRARLPATPLPGRPFIFMNAQRLLSADPTQTDSFVPYFLQRGARAVLGGEASLPVFFAAQFGLEFVSRFVAGEESAGNLLLALRRAYLTQRRNVLGLLYTLYGHAGTRVEWDEPEAEQEIPGYARKAQRPATKGALGSAVARPVSVIEQLREQLDDLLTELKAIGDLPRDDATLLQAHLETAIYNARQNVPNRQRILDTLSAMGKITQALRARYESARILDQQIGGAQRLAEDLTIPPLSSFA